MNTRALKDIPSRENASTASAYAAAALESFHCSQGSFRPEMRLP